MKNEKKIAKYIIIINIIMKTVNGELNENKLV